MRGKHMAVGHDKVADAGVVYGHLIGIHCEADLMQSVAREIEKMQVLSQEEVEHFLLGLDEHHRQKLSELFLIVE